MDDISYTIDKNQLDIDFIHDFLCHKSYWANGLPLDILKIAIENSLCFGVFNHNKQIGFARVVTDFTSFGYLCDLFIDESYRNQGIASKFMHYILDNDTVKQLKRFNLVTTDAHELYQKVGFTLLKNPERHMEIVKMPAWQTN